MKSVGKTTAGHRHSFGMKLILERQDKIFTGEKYGEIAHSLEQAGLLLRGSGREEIEEENHREEAGGKLEKMENERECKGGFTEEQINRE